MSIDLARELRRRLVDARQLVAALHLETAPRATAAAHFACSARDSAKVPCHFSTPSGNIRCVWRPKPDSVACELLASGLPAVS